MSGIWGNKIKLSIFGESHGEAVGINIDGLKPGIKLDMDYINYEMKRRAPGTSKLSTERKEKDDFHIISGLFQGKTTGAPLCCVIYNRDKRHKDYEKMKNIPRPSHADYTAYIKYKGFNDYRGGGHFSARLTAPLVFAGAIARQILKDKGIEIGSHIKSIYNIEDKSFDMEDIDSDILDKLHNSPFPVLDKEQGLLMQDAIIAAKEDGDSLGGIVESAVVNIEAGVGEPFFHSLESHLSQLLFSIPGVKGLEFGAGFGIARMKGSIGNDAYFMEGDNIRTYSNNNGGILGGITNGMPVVFRVAMKPTPSIAKLQRSVDMIKGENTELEIEGRHDPCIVPRGLVVVEAVTAIGILDLII